MEIQKTLGWRLSQTFSLIFRNWQKYLGYNLAMWWINVLIIVLTMVLIYGIIIGVMPNLPVVWSILIGVLVFFILWLVYTLIILANFKLTKDLVNEEETSLDKVINFAFSNLWNKAVVDFWYFLIFLMAILIILVCYTIIWLLVFWFNYEFRPEQQGLGLLVLFLIILISIIVFLYYGIFYYFGFYHCFDEKDFSFKKFRESKKLVKGRFWQVLGNLVVIWIISFVVIFVWYYFAESIVMLITKWLDFDSIMGNIASAISLWAWIAIWVYFALGLYVVLRMLADLFSNIITTSYSYVYYKFLRLNSFEKGETAETNKLDEEK